MIDVDGDPAHGVHDADEPGQVHLGVIVDPDAEELAERTGEDGLAAAAIARELVRVPAHV